MKNLSKESMEKIMIFFKMAHEATENCNEAEFTCPLCGGIAKVTKSSYNGHHHAACSKCDMNFME